MQGPTKNKRLVTVAYHRILQLYLQIFENETIRL